MDLQPIIDFYNQLNEEQRETFELAIDTILGQSDDNEVYDTVNELLNRIQL